MSSYNSRPITQWPVGATVQATDVYLATDVTNIAPTHPTGLTQKYTIEKLQNFLVNDFTGSDIRSAKVGTTGNLTAVYVNGSITDTPGVGSTLTNSGALTALVIDDVTMAVGDRVLVSFQSTASHNGVYIVTNIGSNLVPWVLTRASDLDGSTLGQILQGDFIAIIQGTLNSLSWWFLTSPSVLPINVGTDAVTFQRQAALAVQNWVNQTTPTVTMAINTGYTTSSGASDVTYTLPSASPVGSWVEITGNDLGLFSIAQAAGQQIRFGTTSTTIGTSGSIAASDQYSNIRLTCIVANTVWTVTSFVSNFTIL